MSDFTKQRKLRNVLIAVAALLVTAGLITAAGGLFGVDRADREEGKVAAPVFDRTSGFYEEAFRLTMEAPKGTKIYYTLDGSVPDESSTLYEEPIRIEDATPHDNVWSLRTDVSAGFYEDLIEKYSGIPSEESAPGYKVPDEPVEKCNVVRAVAVDGLGQTSDVTTASYFVGMDAADYDGCGILSLVTEPGNLFDYEEGIYVTGKKFDDYSKTDAIKNYHGQRWRYWTANYTQSGKEWEREVSLEFFGTDGTLVEEKTCGARMQGGCSRGVLPKSFKFYARKSYDGSNSFSEDLFGGGYEPETMILSCGGSEPLVQCCDYMMASLLEDSDVGFARMHFKPYVLFLDGEYWGFYWLETRYDARYCAHYYGVDEDNVVVIKVGEVVSGEEEYKGLYTNMKETITEGDMSTGAGYEQACDLIDMDAYIDYYATQIYIARASDWPSRNYSLWRTVDVRDDAYSDGKWRWMLFDSDSQALKVSLVNDDSLNYVLTHDEMFASLWENETFREAFRQRIFEIADTCFNESRVDAFFEAFTEPMEARMAKSWRRFYGSDNTVQREYFYGKLDSYHQFFQGRRAVVASWFE